VRYIAAELYVSEAVVSSNHMHGSTIYIAGSKAKASHIHPQLGARTRASVGRGSPSISGDDRRPVPSRTKRGVIRVITSI
jgi:hypothetical protein